MSLRCDIVERAYRLVKDMPLCDRCLGRLFGLLGRGLSNRERGFALKTVIVQLLHASIREGDENALEEFRRIAPNIGDAAKRLYVELFGSEPENLPCSLCGSRLEHSIDKLARSATELLQDYEVSTFVVAAHVGREVVEAENEVKLRYGLAFAESIAAELKREVSKRLQAATGLQPDFSDPDVIIDIYYPDNRVSITPRPILLRGWYRKLGRRISQSTWVMYDGVLKYPFSVQAAAAPLLHVYRGSSVIIHAAGREDADARMLGTGRPCIIEVKEPKRRRASLSEAAKALEASKGLVDFTIEGVARRKDVAMLKEADRGYRKLYRVLVVAEGPVDDERLRGLEEFFRGRTIRQRTPRRVRHRRADIVRLRNVYDVRVKRVADNVFEALVLADAGLYVKELVDGDGGDTSPSFAEFLGLQLYCAELDVCMVRAYLPHSSGERLG